MGLLALLTIELLPLWPLGAFCTNALDYKTYNDIKEIIRILQAEGRTILMTSHNYDDLETLCTYIYAIDEGELSVLSSEEMKKRFRR